MFSFFMSIHLESIGGILGEDVDYRSVVNQGNVVENRA